jgi:DNA-binding transcriptional ArsR family regulator
VIDPETPDPEAAPGTVSIFETLATLPSGKVGSKLTPSEMQAYLRVHLDNGEEKARNDRHTLRDELYRDGGEKEMERVINDVFSDDKVKELRKKWVKYARFNNALKRIVNEISTVYAEPAKRTIDDAAGQQRYDEVMAACRIHEQAVQWGRMANLHRIILVGFRVRLLPNGERDPVLDIVTPASFRIILHPNDDKLPIGYAIKTKFRTARPSPNQPSWTAWTDHESFQLRADMSPIMESYVEHKLGVCPFVPLIIGAPDAGIWPGSEGEDLVAAHMSIWMANVLLLKETKSATKQQIITGDGTMMQRGQSADSETPVELADGQSVNTVDMSMDLDLFKTTADHILSGTGANYGLSSSLLTHQGVQSAEARELMRVPLREMRKQQQTPLARFEHHLAIVMAAVLRVDLPALAFDPAGWRIKFGESQTPLTPTAMMELFLKLREAGLKNSIEMFQDLHPGSTVDQAWSAIEENYLVETQRVSLMKSLMAMSGQVQADAAKQGPDGIEKQKAGQEKKPDDADPSAEDEETDKAA